MSLALQRFTVYLRVAVVAVVVGTVGIVLFKNRSNSVPVWFFGFTNESKPVNVVWLMLTTAVGSLTVWRLVWFARGLWRDLRALQERDRVGALAEMERRQTQRAAELDERERRLTENVKDVVAADGVVESRKE